METGTRQHGPLERLITEVDDVLNTAEEDREAPNIEGSRESLIQEFLQSLKDPNDWEEAIRKMGTGAACGDGRAPDAAELLASLSSAEKVQLGNHYRARLKTVKEKYPALK
jgi:hypothetical protein